MGVGMGFVFKLSDEGSTASTASFGVVRDSRRQGETIVADEGEWCFSLCETQVFLVGELTKERNRVYSSLKHVHESSLVESGIKITHVIVLLSFG